MVAWDSRRIIGSPQRIVRYALACRAALQVILAQTRQAKAYRTLQFAHDDEAAGDFSLGEFSLSRFFPMRDGSMSDVRVEETAEGTQALKPDFETNIRHTQLIRRQKLFSFFNAFLNQVLMRSDVECLSE